MKRELNEDEKKFTRKNMLIAKEEVNHLRLTMEHNDFMIDKMLHSNYLAKIREYKKQQRELKGEIAILDETIDISEEQLEVGVEMKEETDNIPVGVS